MGESEDFWKIISVNKSVLNLNTTLTNMGKYTHEFSDEIRDFFYSVYDGNPDNLKVVAAKLLEKGLNYPEILMLATRELKLGLGEAIMLLNIPDYLGDENRD